MANEGIKLGDLFGDISVVFEDYKGLWKATSAVPSIKGDAKKWKGGVGGRDNVVIIHDAGSSISFKTKEISTDILTMLFGGTIVTGATIGVYPPERKTVSGGKITLDYPPSSTMLAVYGRMSGQRSRFVHDGTDTHPQPDAGKFSIVGRDIYVNEAAHEGKVLKVEYDRFSSDAKKWTPNIYHKAAPMSGYFTCMWGGDQPATGRAATVYFRDVYFYSPDFKVGCDVDNINADNEIIMELDEDSVLEVVFQ